MHEGADEIQAQTVGSPLEYATPVNRGRHSVWSVVGFALGAVSALLALAAFGFIWYLLETGARGVTFGLDLVWCSLLGVPVIFCIIGLRRGRKTLAIIGIVLAVLGMIGIIVAAVASPWG